MPRRALQTSGAAIKLACRAIPSYPAKDCNPALPFYKLFTGKFYTPIHDLGVGAIFSAGAIGDK
jgi:hypothetical protein